MDIREIISLRARYYMPDIDVIVITEIIVF